MTSVACQLGELTASSTRGETLETRENTANSLANSIVKTTTTTKTTTKTSKATKRATSKTTTTRNLKVLPLEAWPLVGEFDVNRPLVGGRYNNGNLLALQPNRVACDQRQTRSGSSDSDQLSLLSSFGSLSLDAFQQFGSAAVGQQHQQRQQNNASPPSDSPSRQSMSLDLDQHQFHCSLMLLNSLDFNNYEQNSAANPARPKASAAAIVCHPGGKLANNTSNNNIRSVGAGEHQQAVLASKTSSQYELAYHNHQPPVESSRHTPLSSHRDQQHKVGSLQDCRSHCWLPWNRLSRHQNSPSERADRHQIGPTTSVTSGAGDKRKPTADKDKRQADNSGTEGKAASPGNKLLSVASRGFTRKMSTKEKCKRQKDAERVEKLRLLVNYLKRGSSQPIVSPVALEADEIELAERYKMHVISRDDILKDIQQSINNDQSQQQQQYSGLSDRGRSLAAVGSSATSASTNELKRPDDAVDALKTNSTSVINSPMVVAETSASTPASASSASSVNHHSAHNQNPHIGNVTWVLRHSISDPGNNFEHLPVFSMTSSSSSSSKEHKQCNHSHHHSQHLHSSHHSSTKDNSSSGQQQQQQQHRQAQSGQLPGQDLVSQNADHLSTCAPSSSYSGSSLSNYCLGSGSNGSGKLAACGSTQNQLNQQQQQLSSNLEHQSPKMFYIDDMDMIPVCSSSGCLLNATGSQPTAATPQLAPASALGQQQTSTPLTTANSTTNCCSQPSTPVIYTNLAISNILNNNNNNNTNNNNNNTNNTNIACDSRSEVVGCESESLALSNKNNSPASVQRTWTNPQNLATWIDNEVNSLVHDLEAKSQQLQIKQEGKHNKSGKKKWLSVTSGHSSRRSSSGAQST